VVGVPWCIPQSVDSSHLGIYLRVLIVLTWYTSLCVYNEAKSTPSLCVYNEAKSAPPAPTPRVNNEAKSALLAPSLIPVSLLVRD